MKTLAIMSILALAFFIVPNAHADSWTHPVQMYVQEKHIDNSGKQSHYIVVGLDKDQNQISLEIDRIPYTDWTTNIDVSWATIYVNHTYTFNCWGSYNAWFQWYPICNTHTP